MNRSGVRVVVGAPVLFYMITEYKVINATYEEFHKQVAELLSAGWQPQGGVSVLRSWYAADPTTYYFQAFVK